MSRKISMKASFEERKATDRLIRDYTLSVGDEDATEAFEKKLAQDPRVQKAYAEWQREEKSGKRRPFKVTKDITVQNTTSARRAFEEDVAQQRLISAINRRTPEEWVCALVSRNVAAEMAEITERVAA